jgi:hypothetical protein
LEVDRHRVAITQVELSLPVRLTIRIIATFIL